MGDRALRRAGSISRLDRLVLSVKIDCWLEGWVGGWGAERVEDDIFNVLRTRVFPLGRSWGEACRGLKREEGSDGWELKRKALRRSHSSKLSERARFSCNEREERAGQHGRGGQRNEEERLIGRRSID